jgi:Flp pilus assembly pilin Flp
VLSIPRSGYLGFRLRPMIRRFLKDESGVSLTEFAVAVPVLVLMLVGGMEVSRMVLLSQKVDRVTTTTSDLIGQAETLTQAEINNIFNAANSILTPFVLAGNGRIVVTSLWLDNGVPRVCWQRSFPGTTPGTSNFPAPGFRATLPSGLQLRTSEAILAAETFFNYSPAFWRELGAQSYHRVSYSRPRMTSLTSIDGVGCAARQGS